MSRPRKCRMVGAGPIATFFKPCGIPMRDLTEVYLTIEGFEALRLSDLEGLNHENAAEKMGVSRQTFGRILAQARKTVSEVLVFGMGLRVGGGDFQLTGVEGAVAFPSEASDVSTDCAADMPDFQVGKKIKESAMDKIAITSEGPDLDGPLDPRFGRAAGFIIINPRTFEFTYLDNGSSQAMAQGAGIQAAENVARSGAQAVLTGYVGPKAFKALTAAKITVIQNLENLTVRQAVERFNKGEVAPASQPNKPAHWK